jgi:hypothetical protein
MRLLKIYWFAIIATFFIWTSAGIFLGSEALFTVMILTVLETTFSADNAVVNSKVLTTLSPVWQKLFMTVGIFIAVFVVRFAMPLFIVMLTTGLDFGSVFNLALNDASQYALELHKAQPLISAFGGAFLLMIALGYFIDYEKETHWFTFLEHRLGKLGRFDNITTFIMLVTSVVLYFTVGAEHQGVVLIAAICAMALHSGLELLNAAFNKNGKKALSATPKVGAAAFAAFLYLELLDASFSLDGVIGAFALTTNVVLIMAGLGAGAVWVRAMTVHLVKSKALTKYQYLEHGAHWAIGFLGAIMLLKLYHVELPEWFVGSVGLIFILAAILASRSRGGNVNAPMPVRLRP